MKKQILTEEFKRMQKLAGIIVENKSNEGVDLLDYDGKKYTPESIKNAIDNNDISEFESEWGINVYVETSKFLPTFKKYMDEAGYSFPEEFWDGIDEEAYDGDGAGIFSLNDLKMFNNFTKEGALQLMKNTIKEFIDNDILGEFGLPEDTTSIEDFKQ